MVMLLVLWAGACAPESDTAVPLGEGDAGGRYVYGERLMEAVYSAPCMDAELADLDGDGDVDVALALEAEDNVVLWNDGRARFTVEHLDAPGAGGYPGADSEDVAILDADGDGDLDLLFVSEDLGGVDELYLWDGAGFVDASDRLPAPGVTNGLDHADLDGDGLPEVVLAQAGADAVWSADGSGGFVDVTADWLPAEDPGDISQDAELADLDGDGLLDVVFANEGGDSRLLLQRGGRFTPAPLPNINEESREIDAADLDGDGDLDLVIANVGWAGRTPQDRWLRNDGSGAFTAEELPEDTYETLDVDAIDLDRDGDLDLLRANTDVVSSRLVPAPYEAWLNDGDGTFTPDDGSLLPWVDGLGLDVEAGDLDGDGEVDLYLCASGSRDTVLLWAP